MSLRAPARFASFEELLPQIREVIDASASIATLAHKDADADSLGSSLAFALSMRAMGKTVRPMVPDPMPMLLEHLPGYATVATTPGDFDALFTFDCATVGRFGEKRSLIQAGGRPVVNIDHHVSNEGFGTINLIEPEASATGQVVYRLLRALEAPITSEVATNVYAALFTDTGGFRHENTTEEALRLGADLVALGADPGWVAMKSYKSRSVSQLRLEALAVSRLHTDRDGALVWSQVSQAMLTEARADMQESEGVIDQLQSVSTMKIAWLLKEATADRTKLSVRTRDQFDATAMCIPFGGGGHHRAAGAEIRLPLADAEQRVLEVARGLLDRS
ncbi:MAG: bifunctional oligoribonuclease/PAP phosphatase NrnA [Candidatus Dormibacteria bacterium]